MCQWSKGHSTQGSKITFISIADGRGVGIKNRENLPNEWSPVKNHGRKILLISIPILVFEPLDSKLALRWFYKLKSITTPVIQLGGRLSDNYRTVASAAAAAATAVTRQAASEVTRKNASVYETQLTKFYRCVFVSIMK